MDTRRLCRSIDLAVMHLLIVGVESLHRSIALKTKKETYCTENTKIYNNFIEPELKAHRLIIISVHNL